LIHFYKRFSTITVPLEGSKASFDKMKLQVLLVLGVISLAQAVSFFELVLEEWETYKLIHSKGYDNGMEEKFRMKIYMENKKKVAKHNAKAAKGQYSYHLAMNEFGDLLHHEFVAQMNGFKKRAKNETERPLGATYLAPAHVEKLPADVDWRTHGAVTPVKNQGQCGSCWSFSTTGALEAQHYRKTGVLTSLSEQNLVDCSRSYGNEGCNGGLMDNAFQYIKDNGGIDTEESYPYEGEDDKCRYNPKNKGAWDVGFVDVREGDENDLKTAIATAGPCSVAIDASHESFQFYSHGVYRDPECSPENLDHGVLAVGYGVDEDGSAYWLVKNSWGTSWGDKGFIKIARNEDNMCGIASAASYPLV
jgi:cathepsin L